MFLLQISNIGSCIFFFVVIIIHYHHYLHLIHICFPALAFAFNLHGFTYYLVFVLQEIEFIKQGRFSLEEIEAVASALKIATIKGESKTPIRKILKAPSLEKTVAELENMGVRVFGLDETRSVPASSDGISWCNVAGYEEQKRY